MNCEKSYFQTPAMQAREGGDEKALRLRFDCEAPPTAMRTWVGTSRALLMFRQTEHHAYIFQQLPAPEGSRGNTVPIRSVRFLGSPRKLGVVPLATNAEVVG
jgi:hypothetical protein